MPNIERASCFVVLTPAPGGSHDSLGEGKGGGAPDLDYLRARERTERAAAKNARSVASRRAHQQLAEAYAALADEGGSRSRGL